MEGCEERNRSRPGACSTTAESRAGKRSIAADEAETDMRRYLGQQFRGGIAEAALIKDQEVEPAEV
jgi:hypothetical protein